MADLTLEDVVNIVTTDYNQMETSIKTAIILLGKRLSIDWDKLDLEASDEFKNELRIYQKYDPASKNSCEKLKDVYGFFKDIDAVRTAVLAIDPVGQTIGE